MSSPADDPDSALAEADQAADRARRADRATRGAMAGVLGLEALVVLLVPRALAFTSTGLGAGRTVALLLLAAVMIAAAAMQRRRFGIAAGSVLQLLLIATGIWLAVMWALGAIFAAVWLRLLFLRKQLVGTPGGLRLFVS